MHVLFQLPHCLSYQFPSRVCIGPRIHSIEALRNAPVPPRLEAISPSPADIAGLEKLASHSLRATVVLVRDTAVQRTWPTDRRQARQEINLQTTISPSKANGQALWFHLMFHRLLLFALGATGGRSQTFITRRCLQFSSRRLSVASLFSALGTIRRSTYTLRS